MTDNAKWNKVEKRRAKKFREIMNLIGTSLGPDADQDRLEHEAQEAIDQWEVGPEMEINPPEPTTPLQRLLREYHYICEELLDIQDEHLINRDFDDGEEER
jgi:hypothetical protein